MLNVLRKKKIAKRVLWALALIIIPAFVFWGAGSLSKRRFPYKYIGTIENKRVSFDDFIKSAKDVQIGLFLNYFNQPQALKRLREDRRLLNRLAWDNLIITTEAKKDRVTTSDDEVINFITRHPLFVRGGVFDNKLYKYLLRNSMGVTPRVFEESVRNFIITTKYRASIIEDVTASEEELLQSYRNEFEKAKVSYIVIDKGDFKDMAEISQQEIETFYNKHKERFRALEKVMLQYIAFPHKEEGEKEEALANLKNAYEKFKRRPQKMEEIAQNLNLEVKETAPFSQDEIVPEVGDIKDIGRISFRLKPLVDILPIIEEDAKGISYIIRIKEKIPPRIKSKDEVSPYIMDTLKNKKTKELAREKAENVYEEIERANMSLSKIAKKLDLKLRQTKLISRFDYIEEIGESYKIVDNAFKLEIGEVSKPIEVRKGFAFIEPVELQLVDEEKFEKEKEGYRNKFLAIKKMKALEDWFKKAKENSSLNVDLDRI